jgi:hypothetical protein
MLAPMSSKARRRVGMGSASLSKLAAAAVPAMRQVLRISVARWSSSVR